MALRPTLGQGAMAGNWSAVDTSIYDVLVAHEHGLVQ